MMTLRFSRAPSARHSSIDPRGLVAALALLAATLCPPFAASAEPEPAEWILVKTSDDAAVRVYRRDTPAGLREFRAVTRVQSTIGGLIALFTDVEEMDEWVYRTREVRRLEVLGDGEIYAHTVIGMPWPFEDRDAVLHIRVTQDPATHTVTIRIDSTDAQDPPQGRRVRMPLVRSVWTVTPIEDGQVEVAFQGIGDPGGNLASPWLRWFVDLSSWQAPLSTLEGLRRQVAAGKTEGRSVSYIVEAP